MVTTILSVVIFKNYNEYIDKQIEIITMIVLIVIEVIVYCIVLGFGILIILDNESEMSPVHLDQVNSKVLLITKVFKDKVELFTYSKGAPLGSRKFKDYNKKSNYYRPYYVFLDEIPENLRFSGNVILIIKESLNVVKVRKVEVQ